MLSREIFLEEFKTFNIRLDSHDLIEHILTLCYKHDLNEDQFVTEWLAYSLNKKINIISQKQLNQFESEKLGHKKQNSVSFVTNKDYVSPVNKILGLYGYHDSLKIPEINKSSTPYLNKPSHLDNCLVTAPSPILKKGHCKRKISLNSISLITLCSFGNESCKLNAHPLKINILNELNSMSAKYMYQKYEIISNVFEKIIDHIGNNINNVNNKETAEKEHCLQLSNDLKNTALTQGDLKLNSLNTIYITGQIINQTYDTLIGGRNNSKLTPKTISIRCGKEYNGSIFKLDISELKEFSLFPGQILGIKGTMLNNSKLPTILVNNIYLPKIQIQNRIPSGNISLLIFSSPFTSSNNLDFEYLSEMSSIIGNILPSICILIGPFIDDNHVIQNYENNEMSNSPIEIFQEKFIKYLNNICELMATKKSPVKFLLVASQRDVFHRFNVYPTPSFLPEYCNLYENSLENIYLLPDPCLLNLNGYLLGVTSNDILFQIGSEEISYYMEVPSIDRIERLITHIISQQSFYPLYPPALDINLDYELHYMYGMMKEKPDILILPSELKYFIKDVENTIVINPGRFVKGSQKGTFSQINLGGSLTESNFKIFKY